MTSRESTRKAPTTKDRGELIKSWEEIPPVRTIILPEVETDDELSSIQSSEDEGETTDEGTEASYKDTRIASSSSQETKTTALEKDEKGGKSNNFFWVYKCSSFFRF